MSEVVIQRDSYWRQWFITIGLVVGAWMLYSHLSKPPVMSAFSTPVTGEGANWYFILRMPPITSQYESGIETMRVRYAEWLQALKDAGYRPLLFSELRRLTAMGAGVPPKSVVLMFDPGHRRTYHIVSPILLKEQWSAVWTSEEAVLNARHREFITFETARKMVKSGGWDVGLEKADGTYDFSIGQPEGFTLGQKNFGTWSPMSGGTGLNHRNTMFSLNCLNVNSDWLPRDLVNRLEAEIPVEGPVYFALGEVQNLSWGRTQTEPIEFTLAAEPQQRSAVVSWLGTKGLDNMKIRLKGRGLSGTMSLRLRWDEISNSGIQVAISNKKISVQEWRNGESRIIYKSNRPQVSDFNAVIFLVGDRIALTMDGKSGASLPSDGISDSNGKGVTQVYLHDGVLGAARINNLQVYYEPLPQAAVIFSPGMDPI